MKKTLFLFISIIFASSTFAANAHTSFLSSNPSEGAVFTQMPTNISVSFDEDLMVLGNKKVNQILLRGPNMKLIELSPVVTNGKSVSADVIGKPTGDGLYHVYYRVVAQDGHPISGEIKYSVGKKVVEENQAPAAKKSNSIIYYVVVAIVLVGAIGFARRRFIQ